MGTGYILALFDPWAEDHQPKTSPHPVSLPSQSAALFLICLCLNPEGGALEYESDSNVPAGEQKQGTFGVGLRRRKKGYWVCRGSENRAFFGVTFSK